MSMNFAKSGMNLHLGLVGETYDVISCGTRAVGVAQVPLVATSMPCFQVLLQVGRDQQTNVFVGNAANGCFVELIPGQSITIPINDLNKVYVRAAAEGQTVNWLALR